MNVDSKNITERKLIPFIFSLDDGITWNPCGHNHPQSNLTSGFTNQNGSSFSLGWTWCHPDIVDYIKNLPKLGFYPIFYTEEKKKTNAIKEIMESFPNMNIPVIIGENIFQVEEKARSFSAPIILPKYMSTRDDFDLENIGISPFTGTGYFSVLSSQPDIIILVGQPGTGKSQLSRKLVSKYNFIHIDEDANKEIRKNPDKLIPFLEQSRREKRRCVVDSTNRVKAHRSIYIEAAAKYGFTYIIGWMTRPGFRFDELREIRGIEKKRGKMALNSYTGAFEPPNDPEKWIRLT
jgi:hypothetical protein